MTLNAISREVRADAKVQADGVVGRMSQGGHGVNPGEVRAEVACIAQSTQLIFRAVGVMELAIELGGVEAQGVARERRVAGQAFAAAWVMPDLGPHDAAVINGKGLIQALSLNQRRIR